MKYQKEVVMMNNKKMGEVVMGVIALVICTLLDVSGITPSPYGILGGGIGVTITIIFLHLKP